MSGVVLKVAGAPVWWTARKQDRITTSTCDAESLAVMSGVQYVEYVRELLHDLECTQYTPTPVYNDNTATVKLCVDPLSHKKSVQLTRPMAYVRSLTKLGKIAPLHVRTTEQPADYLTKRLSDEQFVHCRDLAGIDPLPAED